MPKPDSKLAAQLSGAFPMFFRQLFDPETSTYTYLLADTASRQAALVDPVRERADRDLTLLKELGFTLSHVFETHLHADHITAAATLKDQTGCLLVSSEKGAACADLKVRHGDKVALGSLVVEVLATPGHTDDSLSYRIQDLVLTGDALCIRSTGRTDFQNGDAGQLFDSITQVLFTLPDETQVFPCHDYLGRTATTVGEEKRFNSRIVGKDRAAFIALMNGLKLPPPKHIHEALPLNRACGRTQ